MTDGLKSVNPGENSFRDLIENNCYFVDKSAHIKEFVNSKIKFMLYTRPRRFGKTLTMDMLREFFCLNYHNCQDYSQRQQNLFKGLAIGTDAGFCREYMGKYPVLSVTLSTSRAKSYEGMCSQLYNIITGLYAEFGFLLDNSKLTDSDRKDFLECREIPVGIDLDSGNRILQKSLVTLVSLLGKCYAAPVIVLIDEYDVPLHCAHQYGYYDRIVDIIRNLIEPVVKPKPTLNIFRSVLTGCLRISKESFFTGLNNVKVYGISDFEYRDWFGFTDQEVDKLLAYYGLSDKKPAVREWYDGYDFHGITMYSPWDVMNYVYDLLKNPLQQPRNYWSGSSGNDIIYEFVDYADEETLMSLNRFMRGETVPCVTDEQFSFIDFERFHSSSFLYSLLYLTGYLTCKGTDDRGRQLLKIPNHEISDLFEKKIGKYFADFGYNHAIDANQLYKSLLTGDAAGVRSKLSQFFLKFLSVRDTKYEVGCHTFVHGILCAVSRSKKSVTASELETGDGYADIALVDEINNVGAVLEFRRSRSGTEPGLEEAASAGLRQIMEMRYAEGLGFARTVHCYGIGCAGKKVSVSMKTVKIEPQT